MIKVGDEDRGLLLADIIIELQFEVAMQRNLLASLCQGEGIDREKWYKCAELAKREMEEVYGESFNLKTIEGEA